MTDTQRTSAFAPEVMSLQDVSEYLGVTKGTALRFVMQHRIKHLKIGREYRIIRKSLLEFLEEQ